MLYSDHIPFSYIVNLLIGDVTILQTSFLLFVLVYFKVHLEIFSMTNITHLIISVEAIKKTYFTFTVVSGANAWINRITSIAYCVFSYLSVVNILRSSRTFFITIVFRNEFLNGKAFISFRGQISIQTKHRVS